MTAHGRLRSRVAVLAAVGALALAGCGGGSGTTSAPGGPTAASSAKSGASTTTTTKPTTESPPDSVTRTGDYRPVGGAAYEDRPKYYDDGCRYTTKATTPPPPGKCVYGDPAGTPVAIVGDSKVGQWLPALERIAMVEKWRLLFYSRSACAFATEDVTPTCATWSRTVFERLRDEERPALIIDTHVGHSDAVVDSGSSLLTELNTVAGTRTITLADSPQMGTASVPGCLTEAKDYWLDCATRKNDGSGTPALREIAERVPGGVFISLNDAICPTKTRCPVVLDGIALNRGGSHLTASFIAHLTPILHQRLIDAGVAKGPVATGS